MVRCLSQLHLVQEVATATITPGALFNLGVVVAARSRLSAQELSELKVEFTRMAETTWAPTQAVVLAVASGFLQKKSKEKAASKLKAAKVIQAMLFMLKIPYTIHTCTAGVEVAVDQVVVLPSMRQAARQTPIISAGSI
jgi:hypothetical protein